MIVPGLDQPIINHPRSIALWRLRCADALARLIAYHRLARGQEGAEVILRPLIARRVFITGGWPGSRWLKIRVRREMRHLLDLRLGRNSPMPDPSPESE